MHWVGSRACVAIMLTTIVSAITFSLSTLPAAANSDQAATTQKTDASIGGGEGISDGSVSAARVAVSRICVLGGDTRSIELVRKSAASPAPCEVQQRRPKGRETLWRAENDGHYCVQAFGNYLSRLTSLGFDCGLEIPNSLDRAAAGFDPED